MPHLGMMWRKLSEILVLHGRSFTYLIIRLWQKKHCCFCLFWFFGVFFTKDFSSILVPSGRLLYHRGLARSLQPVPHSSHFLICIHNFVPLDAIILNTCSSGTTDELVIQVFLHIRGQKWHSWDTIHLNCSTCFC